MKPIILLLISILMAFSAYSATENASDNDSVAATTLQEVVVKNKRSWISNGVFNYIPTSKEKQLSSSPASLINIMAVPQLKADDKTITTIGGEAVTIAINGEIATDIDIAAFWPKNVKKVEFIQNSSDPRYKGVANIVNFITAKYVIGGVTRIDATQSIPQSGWYTAASKADYKRMTYGVKFEADYDNIRNLHSEEEQTYKNIFYDGVKYDEINQISKGVSSFKSHKFNIAANAVYRSANLIATHSLGIGWNRSPVNKFSSQSDWSVNLFDSDIYESSSAFKSTSYSLMGDYMIKISRRCAITAGWRYGFSNNLNESQNRYGFNPAVQNQANEKTNALNIWSRLTYGLSNKWMIALSFDPNFNWFSTLYSGTVDDHLHQFRDEISTRSHLYWQPVSSFQFSLTPTLVATSYKVGDIRNSEIKPGAEFSARWSPNSKFYMNGSVQYRIYPVKAKDTNDLIIKTSDLKWVEGNPYLKASEGWYSHLSASYSPLDILSIGADVYHFRYQNNTYTSYRVASAEMGGIISTVRTARPEDNLNIGVNLRLRLFDSRLSMTVSPTYHYTKTRGIYRGSLNFWRFNGSINYILGNFNIYASFADAQKSLSNAGEQYWRRSSRLNVGISYGWRNIYADFCIDDLFHAKKTEHTISYSDVLSGKEISEGVGRKFSLNITYTIGYGKKVNPNININANTSIESSLLDL